MADKDFGKRFPDAHGSSGDSHNFSGLLHVVAFIRVRIASQAVAYNRGVAAAGELMTALLPLFPLDVVLFPGTPLPLQVFEPRYKELISECLERKQKFGIIRAEQEGLADVGCTAEIVAVTRPIQTDGWTL